MAYLVAFVARFQRISPEATCSTTVIWLIDLLGKFRFLLVKSAMRRQQVNIVLFTRLK